MQSDPHSQSMKKKNPEQGNNLSVIRWIHFLVFCILFAWSLHQICRIFLGIQCYFSHHLLGKINMAFFCKSDQVNKYVTEFLGEMMLIFQRPIWKSNHKQFTEMLIKIHPLGWTVVSFLGLFWCWSIYRSFPTFHYVSMIICWGHCSLLLSEVLQELSVLPKNST